jgi:hypothetical protein
MQALPQSQVMNIDDGNVKGEQSLNMPLLRPTPIVISLNHPAQSELTDISMHF